MTDDWKTMSAVALAIGFIMAGSACFVGTAIGSLLAGVGYGPAMFAATLVTAIMGILIRHRWGDR